MNLKYTIKKILKEYHLNEDEKSFDEKPNPHQIYIDENGFNKAIEEFGSVELIAKKLNLTPKKLLEIYDPFKDIFSDEEFYEKLIKTLTYIEINSDLREHFKKLTLEKKIVMVIGMIIDKLHSDLINWNREPHDWKVPQTPELLKIIYKDFILDNKIFKRLLSDKNLKLNENNDKFKKRIEDTIKKEGIFFAINFFGGINNLSKKIDKKPIDLARDYFLDKKYSIKDFDIKTGGYDFNFMITDIDENGDIWNVYVKILDGQVTLIMHDDETYDLWDSDLWQQDFWWEIQSEISDVIYDIVAPFTPIQIDLDINHNLE